VFTAGVFTHSALRCHLTPQQQDKTDEERSANNRRRGQCRQILQQGALLPCRLTYRRLPPTVHCGVQPRMCLPQVLKMFVLLSYEVRSTVRSKAAIPALLLSGRPGTRPGAPGRPGDGTQNPRGCHAGRASCRSSGGRHRGPHCCSPLCLTAAGGRAAARVLARVRAGATVSGRRPTTALRCLPPSSRRLVPIISGVPHGTPATAGQRPFCPAARKVRGWRDGGGRDVPAYEPASRGRIGPATARGPSQEGQLNGNFHADLHIHPKFSRACRRGCDIPHLAAGALRKSISVLGTGDFSHPAWRDELKGTLVPAEAGLCACGPISKGTRAGRCRLRVSNRCDLCSRWRSPLSIAVMSTHVKCITLYTLRRSRRRTASPHLRRRSATSRRMGGPSPVLTRETCSRSRLQQALPLLGSGTYLDTLVRCSWFPVRFRRGRRLLRRSCRGNIRGGDRPVFGSAHELDVLIAGCLSTRP
jgi:hypothetical protein